MRSDRSTSDNALGPDEEPMLLKYLAGEGTPEERVAFERRLVGRREQQRLIELFRTARFARDVGFAAVDATAAWDRVCKRDERVKATPSLHRREQEAGVPHVSMPPMRMDMFAERRSRGQLFTNQTLLRMPFLGERNLRPWARYATIVASFVALGVIAVPGSMSRRGPSAALPIRTYTTTVGQQTTVTFADGSHALLGPATTLSVLTQPSDASIDVRVVGQAMFTVVHSNERPFRVHAGKAIARVLGTAFMVRRYDTDSVTQIVVTAGRVSLNGMRDTAIIEMERVLNAGTLATVNDSGRVHVTSDNAVDDHIGWTRGQLVFRQAPMRNVVMELSRAYGVDVRVTDSTLAARPLDWTVSITQRSLSDVLEFLGDVLDVHPVRSGHVITLVPGRSASRRPTYLRSSLTLESRYGR